MRLNETVPYDGVTPDQVFGLICDEKFRGEVCEKINCTEYDVTVKRDGDRADVTITRVLPAEMPDFVKKLTGETVEVVQTENWGPADGNGNRQAEVHVKIKNQPASMTGTSALHARSDGTDLTLEGDVQVTVPFIGRKVEPEVAKAIVSAIRTEAEEGSARLRG